MKTIVYESNTGFTARYAKMLSEKIHLPCCSLSEAESTLSKQSSIIFMSWVEGGKIQKLKDARRRYDIGAVLAVGMTLPSEMARLKLRKENGIPEQIPLFQLVGGVDLTKLKGIKKMMLSMAAKATAKATPKNEEERQIFTALQNGGDLVKADNLMEFVHWYFNQYC